MFDDYVKIIKDKYPDINIDGGNYDPPGINMYLSRVVVSITFFVTINLSNVIIDG